MSMQSISELFGSSKPNGSAGRHLEFLPNPRAGALHRGQRWLEDRLDRGKREFFCEVVELTPELASLLLALNTHNRSLKEAVVRNYTTDLIEGRFVVNGESIIVCSDGILGDGQHRCHAVIATGKSIQTVIVFGVAPEARTTIDQGVVKTAGDYLHMEGTSDANAFAAVASKLLQVETRGKLAQGTDAPTKQQILDYARQHPGIADSLRIVGPGMRGVASKSLLAAAHYLLSRKDREAADAFIAKLIDGTELTRSDPIYVLREKLLAKEKRLTQNERMKAIIMAWNNWRQKKTVRTVTHSLKKGVKLPEIQ